MTVELNCYPNVSIKNLKGIRTSVNKNNLSLNSGWKDKQFRSEIVFLSIMMLKNVFIALLSS